MFNRTYQIRARRKKLQGEQLDITFPRRGRPTKHRALERCGQMQLALEDSKPPRNVRNVQIVQIGREEPETFDDALQMCFPVRPYTEDELEAEFNRLFPPEV